MPFLPMTQVALEQGAALKLVADPSQQLAALSAPADAAAAFAPGAAPAASSSALAHAAHGGAAAAPPPAALLDAGDVFSLLLHICPTELLEPSRCLGRLNVRWRRAPGHGLRAALPPRPPGAARGGALALSSQADADAALDGEGEALEPGFDPMAEPCPDPWVSTALELPRVTVADSLLTARTLGPSQVGTDGTGLLGLDGWQGSAPGALLPPCVHVISPR
jgi:hypothetical protein